MKGGTKNKANAVFRWPASSNPDLLEAMLLYQQLRSALACPLAQYWRLPWELKPFVASDFDAMLQRSLSRRALSAPAGFVYSMHSLRAGSQSEARALGVTLDVVRHQGGYAPGSMVPERKYIDPSCPPSAAGHVFFGWLRPLV